MKNPTDQLAEYRKKEWKEWKKAHPEIMKAVDTYFDKMHEIEGNGFYTLGRRV